MKKWKYLQFVLLVLPAAATAEYPVVGGVDRYSGELDRLLAPDARVERLTDDRFRWSEGPVWIPGEEYLLFSDVPKNTIWRWSAQDGLEMFLRPSAFGDAGEENTEGPGTNGLILLRDGRVLAADHGSRSLYTLDPVTKTRTPGVAKFQGRRFNSPNDLVLSRVRWPGAVFFTDPPYGLRGQDDSPLKELGFNGVFRLDPDGAVTLLDDSMSRPNGIGLSPDETVLYVASSDQANLEIRVYDLDDEGSVSGEPRVLVMTTRWRDAGDKGGNDGLAVDVEGNLWATGPGGVFVITPDGEVLGRIRTGTRAANCAFGGPDGRTLYITSAAFLARVETRVKGLGF